MAKKKVPYKKAKMLVGVAAGGIVAIFGAPLWAIGGTGIVTYYAVKKLDE